LPALLLFYLAQPSPLEIRLTQTVIFTDIFADGPHSASSPTWSKTKAWPRAGRWRLIDVTDRGIKPLGTGILENPRLRYRAPDFKSL
jgi:hypothetical protein